MKQKILIIAMILLIIPISFALSLDEEIPGKTNEKTLCISGATAVDNIVRYYSNEIKQTITLPDLREVNEIPIGSDGKFSGCFELYDGENNLRIESRSLYSTDIGEYLIVFDETSPELGITLPDILNKKTNTFILSIDEPGTIIVTLNGQVSETVITAAGNPELTLVFNEGNNTIKIEVEDEFGNRAVIVDKTVIVDSRNPSITVETIDDIPYSANMQAKLQFIKIKGTIDTTNLQVINFYDSTYFYDKEEDKFKVTRDSTEEIVEKFTTQQDQIIIDENGNFEAFVFVKPGTNKIVLLSTDEAGNINTRPASVDNINPTLSVNFQSSTNWHIINIKTTPERIDVRKLIKQEIRTTIEMRFDSDEFNPEDVDEFLLTLTPDPEADPNTFDNELVHVTPNPTVSFDKKKNEWVVLQDIIIRQFPVGDVTLVPGQIRTSFKGDIKFFVTDPGKLRPLSENIPIDLLFYVYLSDGRYLTPGRLKAMSDTLEGSLDFIKDFTKKVQTVAKYNVYTCAGLWLAKGLSTFLPIPTNDYLLYLACDRVVGVDTPPRKGDTRLYPQGTRDYVKPEDEQNERNPGNLVTKYDLLAPKYDETRCLPNAPIGNHPIFSPVRVADDLVESTKCAYWPGMWIHLKSIYGDISALQGCLLRARRGEVSPGECEVQIAKASCRSLFGFVKKATTQIKGSQDLFGNVDQRPYDTERTIFGGVKKILEAASNIRPRNLPAQARFRTLERIWESGCTNLVSLDWEHIGDVAAQTTLEASPSYPKLIARSELVEEDNKLKIKYYIKPLLVAGLHNVRWTLKFKCNQEKENGRFCKVEVFDQSKLDRYASDLLSGVTSSGNVPPGASMPDLGVIIDENVIYWFNEAELEVSYFVTVAGREIKNTVKSEIKHTNENIFSELCNTEDNFGTYEICETVAAGQVPIETEDEEMEEDITIGDIPSTDVAFYYSNALDYSILGYNDFNDAPSLLHKNDKSYQIYDIGGPDPHQLNGYYYPVGVGFYESGYPKDFVIPLDGDVFRSVEKNIDYVITSSLDTSPESIGYLYTISQRPIPRPPVISITRPIDSDYLFDIVTFSGTVSDPNGKDDITSVELYLNSGSEDKRIGIASLNQVDSNTVSWSLEWITYTEPDSEYIMTIIVTDGNNQKYEKIRAVTIDNN